MSTIDTKDEEAPPEPEPEPKPKRLKIDPGLMAMYSSEARQILLACGVLERDGHFALPNDRHSDTHLNFDPLFLNPDLALKGRRYAHLLAQACRDLEADAIMGLEPEGKLLAPYMEEVLGKKRNLRSASVPRDAHGLYATNTFITNVRNRRVLLVKNVISEAKILTQMADLVLLHGGTVAGAAVGWNRGTRTGEHLGLPALISLVHEPIEDYVPGTSTCPKCRAGVPVLDRHTYDG